MNLDEIKTKMQEYRDYYGSPLIGSDYIKNCQTEDELIEILDYHEQFIEAQCNEAQNGVSRFKRDLGLY